MLEALFLIPLIGCLILFFCKGKTAEYLALLFSVAGLGLAVYMLFGFNANLTVNAPLQYEISRPWSDSIKSKISFGLDGMSMLFVLLTEIVVLLALLYASGTRKYDNRFYALVLMMQFGLIGVFTALDGLMFYFFWEITLIPIWLIAGLYGREDKRITFTTKFFVYTFVGSLFMLGGLIYTYNYSASFHVTDLYNSTLNLNQQTAVFWFIFAAFAVKLPVFPFHTWQPDTYTYSPTPGSMLLSGIMLKMAVFGVLRYLLPVAPLAVKGISGDIVIILAVIGVIYGALIAIVKWDAKRIIAYSSLSHVGLMTAGIFATAVLVVRSGILSTDGGSGALIQSFAHGVNVAGLFICAGILYAKFSSYDIRQMGGLARVAPRFSVLFFIVLAGSMAVPLTNGFIGEFILLKSVFQYNILMSVLAGLTVILCAVYMLRLYVKAVFGEGDETLLQSMQDINAKESIALILIAFFVLSMGIYPEPVLALVQAPLEFIYKSMLN